MRSGLWAALSLTVTMTSGSAWASCSCECVNGQIQPLCTGAMELPPLCPATLCGLPPASLPPLAPLALPPLGATTCEMQQVRNPMNGQYQWRRVCQQESFWSPVSGRALLMNQFCRLGDSEPDPKPTSPTHEHRRPRTAFDPTTAAQP
jgi:hypothetical protein